MGIVTIGSGCARFPAPEREEASADADLAQQIQRQLRQDPAIADQPFGISVRGGVVVLHGTVKNEMLRSRILSIVRSTPGVLQVVDRLTVW